MEDFINEKEIEDTLEDAKTRNYDYIEGIIQKSLELNGLSLDETAALLQCDNKKLIWQIFITAKKVKESIYGKRLVFFAPLYLTNICVNNCVYCGFRKDNKELKRKALTQDEIKREVEILEKQGHKRLLLVAGEDPKTASVEYLEESIRTIYNTKNGLGEIRRVNVNVAPQTVENFRRLKKAGIGTYQCFQETYHKETYKKMHPSGPKSDYYWRLFAMDRAQEAGIDDVGIGILFGLYDYKFEILALLSHCKHLESEFNVGPHTISVPRIEPALNAPIANNPPHPVSDEDFKKIIAIIRLSVPYTGMILSTRERLELRDEIFNLGISQISAGSRTNPGAYSENGLHFPESEQFSLGDIRTLAEVVRDISLSGFSPSFCTACYRLGRTGEDFMSLAKPGDIQNFCLPNSILTYKEYLLDYGSPELIEIGNKVIKKHVMEIPDERIRDATLKKIKQLEEGKRDLYF